MCNSIFLSDSTIPKAKDGEEVELKVKGIYHTDENGVRTLEVLKADGYDVADPEESDCGCDEHQDLMDQDAEDALRLFVIKTQKRK